MRVLFSSPRGRSSTDHSLIVVVRELGKARRLVWNYDGMRNDLIDRASCLLLLSLRIRMASLAHDVLGVLFRTVDHD